MKRHGFNGTDTVKGSGRRSSYSAGRNTSSSLFSPLFVSSELQQIRTATGSKKSPAIVISHTFGGVKEQTAGLYAQVLFEKGFITLAFDAAHQGENGGEPRYLEDPYQRAEDIKSAVTFLTTRPEVDENRIGALGICASGGYVPFAAQTDRRIKAMATISAADTGRLFREGLLGTPATVSREGLMAGLEEAGKERTREMKDETPHLDHIVPNTVKEIPDVIPTLYKEGTDYYRTSRAQHPSTVNWYITRSLATYSSYVFVDMIAPHPSVTYVMPRCFQML